MVSTFHLRTFRIHIMMYVGGAVALDIFGSLFMHYIYVLRVGILLASQAMSLMTLFQFFAIPFFTWLCIRVGNGNAYKLAIALIPLRFAVVQPGLAPALAISPGCCSAVRW